MTTRIDTPSALAGRLSADIASLQEAFRKLSKAATPADLAGKFSGVLKGIFPDCSIDVVSRPRPEGDWQVMVDGGAGGLGQVRVIPASETATASMIRESPSGVSVIQQMVDRSSIGIVLRRASGETTDAETLSLRLFVHLFDAAYQELHYRKNEKELIFSLNQRVLQLNSLIDTGIEVAKLDHESSPQRLALERAASLTNASKGRVRVTTEGEVREELFFPSAQAVRDVPVDASRIETGFLFSGSTYSFELFEKESRRGVLPFDETDQLLLDALARQVHASLENRYLHRQALEKQRFEQDVAVAASIQQKILPAALPTIEGYDIAGVNIPSKSVGGDYYDCIALPGGRYALVMADVAGKGIPAALLVSSLHAYLSAYLEEGLALVDLTRRLNRAIGKASTDDKFITAFFALLDPSTGALESVNAGHTPVFVLRADGTGAELSKGGLPLGMLDLDLPYETDAITLGPGDRLLLYTDGIPEAHDPEGVLFDTVTPLKDLFEATRPPDAAAFIQHILDELRRFTRGAPQADDITAMYLLRR
jgi:serine phosphatase RsbU (regulator of sigma subunit)